MRDHGFWDDLLDMRRRLEVTADFADFRASGKAFTRLLGYAHADLMEELDTHLTLAARIHAATAVNARQLL